MRSRVVPGSGETIATSRRASALTRLDLPAFGGPSTTTSAPSRSRSPRCGIIEVGDDLAPDRSHDRPGLLADRARDVLLVGKIQLRLDQRTGADQPVAPRLIEIAQRPAGLPHRLTALHLGLGGDQIGETLDLGQIEAPVEEGPAREFARLGRAKSRDRRQRREDRLDHRPAAVNLQLDDILAGEAVRAGKEQDKAAVEHVAVAHQIGAGSPGVVPGSNRSAFRVRIGRSARSL